MGIRGPKSAEAQLTPSVAELRGDARPEPPEDLTEEQAVEWRAVVDRLPTDWFSRETHGLLSQYVRHVVTAGASPGSSKSWTPWRTPRVTTGCSRPRSARAGLHC
jgi:hypothetical protein